MAGSSPQERGRNPRVLFVSDLAESKGHIYRVLHNVAALESAGLKVSWAGYSEGTYDRINQADIVILFRGMWDDFTSGLYACCRRQGIPIGFDIDDLIFDSEVLTEKNFDFLRLTAPAVREDWLVNRIGNYRRAILESDFCTVSTLPLATAVEKLQIPAYVLQNGFDAKMLRSANEALIEFADKPSSHDGWFRLGYASGTPTHQKDFATIAPTLCELMDDRPDLLLSIVGHLNMGEFPELDRHKDRIETRPLVPHSELLREYARFDVNLAPLEIGNPFCEAKSALKYVEAALVEVPTVAAATLPYREVITNGETGWTAQNPKEWRARIGELIDNAVARKQLGKNARQNVQETLGPEAKYMELQRMFSSVARL
ncbi:glycosyltransferase [Roseovarius sp. 2305UL8-3]|uniref:glycosyltransferase n=1 Tax=Roseovarius conchicola TaxID=3121636 RepID=UPI0035296A20